MGGIMVLLEGGDRRVFLGFGMKSQRTGELWIKHVVFLWVFEYFFMFVFVIACAGALLNYLG